MTTSRKTSVTHADGTVSTRTSKTKTYAYAVQIAPAPAAAYAADLIAKAQASTVRAAKLRAAAEQGSVAIVSRGFSTRDELISHQATLRGTDRQVYTWSSADGRTEDICADGRPVVSAREHLIESARKSAEHYDTEAARYTSEAARVLAAGTPVGDYGILRWSSTAALAAKAIREFEFYAVSGHAISVVPVDA